MKKFRSGIILAMCISIWGCSNANDDSILLDSSGKHPAGWVAATIGGLHPAAYQANQSACVECHGSSQDSAKSGGISGVSCFSASRNGITCHPGGPSSHPAGWSSAGSHGSAAKAAAPGLGYCAQCHGTGFAGGVGRSCMTCHAAAPHPAAPWRGTTASGTTHTTTSQVNAAECARCHLNNQRLTVPQPVPAGTTPGCFNSTLCHGVESGHPAGWSAAGSHGGSAKAAPGSSQGFLSCTQCHGTDFVSGNGTSCRTCHTTAPHPAAANWRSTGTITHTTTAPGNAPVCADCHNSVTPNLAAPNAARFANSPSGSFKGGSPNCFTSSMCHGDVRKTSNCDACHSVATTNPFKSMAGATATSDPQVGAHVKHLGAAAQTSPYSSNINCSECHTVPGSPAVSGTHRNASNDIVFGTLAKTGSLTPVYTAATGVCANTYCHGNTLDKPASAILSPAWPSPFLTGNASVDCTKCHGYPPATATHSGKTPTDCIGCHSHVNAAGNGFTDLAKHVNGSVEAGGGHSFPNPGSLHRSAANGTGCLISGCHVLGAASSSYPVNAGTPPNCRSCHLNANPGTAPQCSDCHGSVSNNGAGALLAGRPIGGTAFPNRPGEHNRSQHIGRACTACHPFTSGDARHGWSNRQKSAAAQVGGAGTSISSWNAVTKSCTPTCHGSEIW